MALIQCQEYGKQISTNAESCPHCGTTKSKDNPAGDNDTPEKAMTGKKASSLLGGWQNKIPVGSEFDKLESGGQPYRCAEWKHDGEGRFCMYYELNNRRKRIPHAEIDSAIARFKSSGRFDREAFKTHCPVAFSDGGCGFAVIVRILERFCDAKFVGNGVIVRSDTGPR